MTVQSTGLVGLYTSLAVVNGRPAISYFDDTNDDLKYVRALDESGTSWGTPVTLDSTGAVGLYTSLVVVNGTPAISYYDNTNGDLKYVRATDSSGANWGTPLTLDSTGIVGQHTSLAVVNGNPAISYLDVTNDDLKYTQATDGAGTSWGTPVALASNGHVGSFTSLAVVNGTAAISYWDFGDADLKWLTYVPPPLPDIAVAQAGAVADGGSVAFGAVAVGGSSPARTFTITNPGTADLTSLMRTKDGTDSADFTISALSGTSIPTGSGTVTFTVTFSPNTSGAKTAALHIVSNVTGTKNPFDITLTGEAFLPQDTDSDGLLDSWELTYWPTTTGHGPLDDEDHDGIVNLLEYALSLNPTLPSPGGLPPVTDESGYLTMTMTKQPGIAYQVQSAGSLLPAQPDSFSASTTTVLINNATTLKVRDNFLISTNPVRFMRLEVTAAP